ncbi:unnamed protein product [Hermetia illucens]|uniref:Uncharacterized protein n=1 Tax=Hermetia illucens TaxID=343691 RepID=A0A7R8UFK3_HERIL|nr:unnamed protein product [Hermetia illucens]
MDDGISPGASKRIKFGDNGFEETLEKRTEEINCDTSDLDSDDDYKPSDHDTESEIEAKDEDIENPDSDAIHTSYLYDKNRFK